MGILSWIIVGLIAGALAKFIMPGAQRAGIIVTMLLGVVGGLLGGYVMSLLGETGLTGFDLRTVLVATVGALVVLFIYGLVRRK